MINTKENIKIDFKNLLNNKPISIHLDMIGLYKLSKNNTQRLNIFRDILLDLEKQNQTIFIPTYSYSYTKKEIYDIKNSISTIGMVTDFLREKDYKKRTWDPNFSYLIYSQKDFSQHFNKTSYTTFGSDSLIDYLFKNDGYLAVIGAEIRMLTEIYYLESKNRKQFNLNYRYDKDFNGITKDLNENLINTKNKYFCRNIEEYPDKLSDFLRLQNELKKENLIQQINLGGVLPISFISIQKLEEYLIKKWEDNKYYLIIDKNIKAKIDNL